MDLLTQLSRIEAAFGMLTCMAAKVAFCHERLHVVGIYGLVPRSLVNAARSR